MRWKLTFAGFLLAAGLTISADAQRPRLPRPQSGGGAQTIPQFGSFFEETEREREAIESIAIDAATEKRMGDSDLETYLAGLKQRQIRVNQRGRDFEYVSSLVDLIHARMEHAERYKKIRVHIAETSEKDARAFPGGSIVVMTGLIEMAESEAALVGVLGHELSHIDHGHQLRMMRAMELAQGGWQRGMANPQAMQNHFMTLAKNFARPFRQEDEVVADQDGARWAFELGYEPLEFARLFERFDKNQPRGRSMAAANVPSFLLTHPSYDNRMATICERAATLQRGSPEVKLYVGRKNLEQRVTRKVREFPE